MFFERPLDDFKSSRELCLCACVFVRVGRVVSEVSGETQIIGRYCLFLFSAHDELNLVDVSKELRIPFFVYFHRREFQLLSIFKYKKSLFHNIRITPQKSRR